MAKPYFNKHASSKHDVNKHSTGKHGAGKPGSDKHGPGKQSTKQKSDAAGSAQHLINELDSLKGVLENSPAANSIERDDIPTLNDIAVPAKNEVTQPHNSHQKNPPADIPTLTTSTQIPTTTKEATTAQQTIASQQQTKQAAAVLPANSSLPQKISKPTTPHHKVNVNNPFIPDSVKAAQAKSDHKTIRKLMEHSSHTINSFQEDHALDNLRKAKSMDEGSRNKLRQELEMQSEIILQEVIDEFIPLIEAAFHKRMRNEIDDIIDQIINH